MSTLRLKADMSELERKLKEKGCCNVSAYALVYAEDHAYDYITLGYRTGAKGESKSFNSCDPYHTALAAAHAHIDELPAEEDRNRAEFYSLVSRAAEFGRSIGMDETLINPLAEMAKSLASNALTGPKTVEHDDEIPF